jgi:hypothetical protein
LEYMCRPHSGDIDATGLEHLCRPILLIFLPNVRYSDSGFNKCRNRKTDLDPLFDGLRTSRRLPMSDCLVAHMTSSRFIQEEITMLLFDSHGAHRRTTKTR